MAHANRPRVHGGLHPFDSTLGIAVPAPMVSRRSTPPGHLANLESLGKETVFALIALDTLGKLSDRCINLLSRGSSTGSASEALVELMMNRVTPRDGLVRWLEKYYLGTWTEPHQAVEAMANPAATSSLSREQLIRAYERATQVFMIREHYFENGKVAVSLTKSPGLFSFWVVSEWVLEGRIPPHVTY